MTRRTLHLGVALAACVLLSTVASAETVVLQNGLDGYTGTQDVQLNQSPSSGAGYAYGGGNEIYTYSGTGETEIGLLQFDLSGISASSITSATLEIFNNDPRYGGPTRAKQIGMAWTAGTATHWSHIVEGAGHRHANTPTAADLDLPVGVDWVDTGSGGVWKLDLDKPLGGPDSHGSRTVLLRRGENAQGGRTRYYDWTRRFPVEFADLASLEGSVPGTDGNDFNFYYDAANYDIYAKVDGDGRPDRINFIYADDYWDWNSRLATDYWEGDLDVSSAENTFHSLDVTELVRIWLGLDGETQELNAGWQIDAVNSTSNGRDYFTSEVTGMYDVINGVFEGHQDYNASYAVDAATLRPKLTIEFVAIPEPTTMAPLAVGGILGVAAQRRRRRA
jgi:hypothetical protein